MQLQRQTSIEFFVRDCSTERLFAWLESVLGELGPVEALVITTICDSQIGSVVVTPNIEGGPFMSVWFISARTPWGTDVECARQAAKALDCIVRCDPGQHYPEIPDWVSDQFLEISGGEERIVTWAVQDDDNAETLT